VKIIGELGKSTGFTDSKGFNRRQRSKRKFHLSLYSLCFLLLGRIFSQLRKGRWLRQTSALSPVTPALGIRSQIPSVQGVLMLNDAGDCIARSERVRGTRAR
jgi:hypothetical protein